jgi:hypothetical protein
MAETPVVIHEHQFLKLKSVLARTCVECAARVVLLVDRDGHPLAFHGDIAGLDTTSFSSLAAGNVAATTSMAKLIGEDVFSRGRPRRRARKHFYQRHRQKLLVVVFDGRSTISLVKLRTKKASFEVAALLDEVARDSELQRQSENSFFAEITDDDIDSLFS